MIRLTPTTRVNGPDGWRQRRLTLMSSTRHSIRRHASIPWGPRRTAEVTLPMLVLRVVPRRLWAWVPR